MSPRTFAPMNLVTLPRYSAAGAIALGTAVQSVITEVGDALPASCQPAAKKCNDRLADLRKSFGARVGGGTASEELVALDVELDASWAAFSGLVGAFLRAPFDGDAASARDAARRLQSAIFTDGLRFIQLPYKLEWAESQVRLDLLDEPGLATDVEAIGGAPFIALVRVKHKAYGDAQGLSKEAPAALDTADVRSRLDQFSSALRAYVVKVSATVEDDDDASRALADRLLAPIASWQSSATSTEVDAPGDLPAQPVAPAPAPTP